MQRVELPLKLTKIWCTALQIVPAMGGNQGDLAHVISTIFFISGIITLLQTVWGDRLPIIQVSLSGKTFN